jgi:hypothetical protein
MGIVTRRILAALAALITLLALLATSPPPAEAGVVDLPTPPDPGCLDSVAGGVGLHQGVKTPAGGIVLDVPGPVVQVVVEWIGRDDANSGVSNLELEVTGPGGTVADTIPGNLSTTDPESENGIETVYGWWADITTMLGDGEAGEYTFDIEPFASFPGPGRSWGAAVTVVYDTSPCPGVSEVLWKIGADFVFGGATDTPPTSDLIVWDWTDPLAEDTVVTLRAAFGGADTEAMVCRVTAVWLAAGTGAAPADSDDLIDEDGNAINPDAVEALLDPFNPGNQPCPPATFEPPVQSLTGGNIGPQFSLVEFDVLIPAGSEWLAMQLESPRDNGGFEGIPESGAWAGSGLILIPIETQQQDPDILIEKTVLDGAGQPCPGVEGEDELVVGAPGDPVTYCFRVENTGDTFLFPVVIEDPDLGISNLDMTLVSGDDSVPFPPGGELVYSYETVIDGDLLNVATVTGTPVDEEGNPLDLPDVTDDNDAEVQDEVPETTTTVPEVTAVLDPFCDNDTPWLAYDIEAPGLSDEATITFSEGADSAVYTVAVGSGQVLWPGAEIDTAGNPIDWPGWDQTADGTWFLNPDNPFAWARETVQVTVEVNPTFGPVTLEYPPAEPLCNAVPPVPPPDPPDELPATGSQPGGQALFGVLLLLAGIAVVAGEARSRGR